VSLVLRLVGRDPDPAGSKEHVLLSLLAERRLRAGSAADLASLLADLTSSPIDIVGALPLENFLPKSERRSLAAALNTLLASPTFASWRTGATLDVDAWLTPRGGRTPARDRERRPYMGAMSSRSRQRRRSAASVWSMRPDRRSRFSARPMTFVR